MPTMIQTTSGKVTGLWGKAMIRGADGKMRPLNMGDYVVKGDVILTTQNGIVQLTPDQAPVARAMPGDLDDIEAPGAGAAGGSLQEGLRVGRVAEATTAADLGQTTFFEAQRIGPSPSADIRQSPVADPNSLRVNEDTLLPVVLTGRDPDGNIVSFTIVTVPTGGLLTKGDGTPIPPGTPTVLTPAEAANLVFVPAPNFNGDPGNIEFFVTDDSGFSSPQTPVEIVVTPVNDVPVAGTVPQGPDNVPVVDPSPNVIPGTPSDPFTGNYRATTPEDTPVSGRVNATDVDGDTLTYAKSNDPAHGTVTVNPDGSWTYVPSQDYNGPDQFVVTVSDGNGGTDTSTVFIDVTPVPDVGIAKSVGSPSVFEGENLDFQVLFTAVVPDAFVARLSFANGSATVGVDTAAPLVSVDGGRSFAPVTANADGIYSVVMPAGAPVDSLVVRVPTVVDAVSEAQEQFTLTVSSVSIDGLAQTTSADKETMNFGGTLAVTGPSVTGVGTIIDPSAPPAGADTVRSTPEDTPLTLQPNDFGFSDPNPGETLTAVRIDSLPAKGSLLIDGVPVTAGQVIPVASISGGGLTYQGLPNENGSPYSSFTFSVQDPTGLFDPAPNLLTLNVTPLSDTPVVGNDTAVTPEDTPISINVLANDSDADAGDVLTIVAVNDTPVSVGSTPVQVTDSAGTPIGAVTLTPQNTLLFTPVPNYNGPATFTYTVSDGLTPVKGTVDVTVTPVNDAPVANPDVVNTPEEQPVTIPVLRNDTDPDGDPLTIGSFTTTTPNGGTVDPGP